VVATVPEPKGKLDTMTAHAFAMAMAALGVNGPEDDRAGWEAIDWRTCEDDVRRLRQHLENMRTTGDLWSRGSSFTLESSFTRPQEDGRGRCSRRRGG